MAGRRKAVWAVALLGALSVFALSMLVRGLLQPAVTTTPVAIPSIGAELWFLDASSIARRGSGRVVVLRLPRQVELVPHSYKDEGLAEPLTIGGWAKHLGAPVVFNAGQFDENLRHLGWLKKDGAWIVSHRKPQWLGLLLSGPSGTASWVRIADLAHALPSVHTRYRHVVQSMMLFDHDGNLRVRDSDKTACRTVVAEDKQGRLLILLTEGAATLGDFARWLMAQPLGIVRAMNLDGGIESQLAVQTPELELEIYGQYGTGQTVFDGGPGTIQYPLPTVVALRSVGKSPRRRDEQTQ